MAEKKPGTPARVADTEPPPPPETIDAAPVLRPPREWATAKGTPGWHLSAAAAGERWPIDKTLSETDYDKAIERALGAKAG